MKMKCPDTLPDWFKLENYQSCENFGPVEWYACLKKRAHVALVVEGLPPDEPASIRTTLAAMRERPLGAANERNELIATLAPRPAVRTATWTELGRASRLDRLADSAQAPAWQALGTATASNNQMALPSDALIIPGWLDKESDAAVAIVDLNATDSVVVSAFKLWLKQARAAATHKTATRNRPNTDRWAEYGLLPYLDLQIWCIEVGCRISEEDMATALRPNSDDGGIDWIGDSLAPLARSLMADLSPLRALAAENIEEWAKAQRSALLQGSFQP